VPPADPPRFFIEAGLEDAPARSALGEISTPILDTGEPAGLSVGITLVLVHHGDDWRIVQTHASAPSNG
jgi:SnoaL-like domain